MSRKKNPSPLKAIRENCLECSGGSRKEVRYCHITDCHLWPYRMGTRPETLKKNRPELLNKSYVLEKSEYRPPKRNHPGKDTWKTDSDESAKHNLPGDSRSSNEKAENANPRCKPGTLTEEKKSSSKTNPEIPAKDENPVLQPGLEPPQKE